jgi:hypothetical protein
VQDSRDIEGKGQENSLAFSHASAPFLLGLLGLLTFWRYLSVGFTDHDSMYTAIRCWHGGAFQQWCTELAVNQGRIGHFYMNYLNAVPFLVRSPWWYHSVTLGMLAINTVVFCGVVTKCLNSKTLGYFCVLVYLAALPHAINHSLITGYFVYFHAVVLLLMLALWCFHHYLETGAGRYLGLATFLFALTMGREDSPLYVVLFALLAFLHFCSFSLRKRCLKALVASVPFLAVAVVFVGVLLLYRLAHPSDYTGNALNLSKFSVPTYLHALLRYSLGPLPGFLWATDRQYAALFAHFADTTDGLPGLFHAIRVEWVARAAIVFFGLAVLAGRLPLKRCVQFSGLGVFALLLVVLPNAVLSASPHYQLLAVRGLRATTHYAYYVFFGITLLITCLFAAWVCLAERWGGAWGRRFAILAVAIAGALGSLVTDYTNHHIVLSQAKSHQKWVVAEKLFTSPEFESIPENSVLYAPSLWAPSYMTNYYKISSFSGAHLVPLKPGEQNYWEKLCEIVSSREIRIFNSWKSLEAEARTDAPVYYLRYVQDDKVPCQYVVFAPIERAAGGDVSLVADESLLFSYSRYRRVIISYATQSAPREQLTIAVDWTTDTAPMPHILVQAKDLLLESIEVLPFFTPSSFE